ncbi:MAG TPA: uracil-DNA glycosylase [Gallionella sp.]|nr:uracil-DNA glycosylase [Gallionella sp.]
MDEPKSLGVTAVRDARVLALELPHVEPLSVFVRDLRACMGPNYDVPYFDPADGGVHADCLFLLEAPGPKAVKSGFVSRDNPDESAKNFFLLNREAGIDRERTVVWNIVPWYVGSATKIRPANALDISAAAPALTALLSLLPHLHSIVLVGGKAASARNAVSALAPEVRLYAIPHPSPMFVNRSPTNRHALVSALHQVAANLPPRPVTANPSLQPTTSGGD